MQHNIAIKTMSYPYKKCEALIRLTDFKTCEELKNITGKSTSKSVRTWKA